MCWIKRWFRRWPFIFIIFFAFISIAITVFFVFFNIFISHIIEWEATARSKTRCSRTLHQLNYLIKAKPDWATAKLSIEPKPYGSTILLATVPSIEVKLDGEPKPTKSFGAGQKSKWARTQKSVLKLNNKITK